MKKYRYSPLFRESVSKEKMKTVEEILSCYFDDTYEGANSSDSANSMLRTILEAFTPEGYSLQVKEMYAVLDSLCLKWEHERMIYRKYEEERIETIHEMIFFVLSRLCPAMVEEIKG